MLKIAYCRSALVGFLYHCKEAVNYNDTASVHDKIQFDKSSAVIVSDSKSSKIFVPYYNFGGQCPNL